MATRKPDTEKKAAQQPDLEKEQARKAAEQESKAEQKARGEEMKEAQEPDLKEGQQTGGTHDRVTSADVHVEPARAKAIDPDLPEALQPPAPTVGAHDAKQDKVDYAAKAELEVPAKDQEQNLAPFDAFVRKHEDEAQLRGAVVAQITHPDASEGIYEGRDAGIRVKKGPASAVYSDGSKH